MTIGERISTKLKEQNKSQRWLAKEIGVSEPAVSRWIKGERDPRPKLFIKIANALYVSPEWLLTGKEEKGFKRAIILLITQLEQGLAPEEMEELKEIKRGLDYGEVIKVD